MIVGLRALLFAVNVVSFSACLWSRPFSIVGRYSYGNTHTDPGSLRFHFVL